VPSTTFTLKVYPSLSASASFPSANCKIGSLFHSTVRGRSPRKSVLIIADFTSIDGSPEGNTAVISYLLTSSCCSAVRLVNFAPVTVTTLLSPSS
jgi:hypothetical protein